MQILYAVLVLAALPAMTPEAPTLPDSRNPAGPRAHDHVSSQTPLNGGDTSPVTPTERAITSCLESRGLDAATCRNHVMTESSAEPSRQQVEAIRKRLDPVPAAKEP